MARNGNEDRGSLSSVTRDEVLGELDRSLQNYVKREDFARLEERVETRATKLDVKSVENFVSKAEAAQWKAWFAVAAGAIVALITIVVRFWPS